ncbi:FHA domain-containing protein PS1 [Andrographis paniculata]|uniref:FHA domain-containing protein PS1 n=1 Tax=Andrographis paniculata TaxID=175694 RepID=UPI0021E6F368|nr:FHA domain-containing protein PS1 [Andrographis paniculata]
MAENQGQATGREREIPVFTVLKNNCILKNIFLLDTPPATSPSSSLYVAENDDQESQGEEILVVGRHPDCNIKLEHPSISRFHLRVHSKPSSRSLSVTDLSSVHGTWISGTKIQPGVIIHLTDGDTLRLGASSRLYKFSWVPISYAYDIDNPFVPELSASHIVVEEEIQEAINEDENALPLGNDQVQTLSNNMEALTMLYSDEDFGSSMQKGSPPSSILVSQEFCISLFDKDEVENIKSSGGNKLEKSISDGELCGLDKENSTPRVHSPLAVSPKVAQLETTETSGMMSSMKRSGLSIWSRRGKLESVNIQTSERSGSHARINMSLQSNQSLDENNRSKLVHKDNFSIPYNDEHISQENTSPNSPTFSSVNRANEEIVKCGSNLKSKISSIEQDEEEIFTPDKENMTPNTRLQKSMKNRGILEEAKHLVPCSSSPLTGANNSNRKVLLPAFEEESQNLNLLQERKSTNSMSKSRCSKKKPPTVLNAGAVRDPFHPLPVNSSDENTKPKPTVHELKLTGRRSTSHPKTEAVDHSHKKTMKVEDRRWIIVVDSTCLLNKDSRKELQLLRGLRGTTLVIPRIVVRELDCMLRRASFFRRMTEVSAALKWIEECVAISKWWIHLQSSAEEGNLIPLTPPASSSPHWLSEDKIGALSVRSTPFSPYSLEEIVTPTATDHILECALFFKRIRNDGQLILLTDDATLKIKAMAEGVICETVEEFRSSLVNPFSKRFLYDSSPIGPSWSCVDDVVLKEKYYPSPSKKLSKSGEGVKGLKLILHHNSNFRQTTPESLTKV